jgi:F420-0:gamma-glutamyl ligase
MSNALGTAAGEGMRKFAAGMASTMVGGWSSNQVMATDPRYSVARMSSLFASGLGNAVGSSITDAMGSPDQRANNP